MATRITLGQFSTSPVVIAARRLGLDTRNGLHIVTTAVSSSPGQFAALQAGEIDVAVTSPDNVLLYATTDRNPVGSRVPVRMLRPIDRGLGLALTTRPEITSETDLAAGPLGVDVLRSGFALLLFTMLGELGIDFREVPFEELGSTPARGQALIDGRIAGTILNAEARVRAERAGMTVWRTSADVSDRYLGTVLAAPEGTPADVVAALTSLWSEATAWLLHGPRDEVQACLQEADEVLGSDEYLSLLRDPQVGLVESEQVDIADLLVLVGIRQACGAYAPDAGDLAALVSP